MRDCKPHVLIYSDATRFAGIERHILELAAGLDRLGTDVAVGCPGGSPLAERVVAAGVRMVGIPSNLVRAVRKIRQVVKDEGFNIVHAHNGWTRLHAIMGVLWAETGAACVATQHFIYPAHCLRQGVWGDVTRGVHRSVNESTYHFFAASLAVRNEMVRRGDAKARDISVIPHGIAEPPPVEKDAARRKLKIDLQVPVIVFAGRLEREKNIPSLIRAIAALRSRWPHVQCLIAGEGSQRKMLASLIKKLDLQGNVRLLCFCQNVNELIGAADMLVLPSDVESFGLVVLEAMALGKPVVATRSGGPEEIVLEGETGILVEPDDTQALAQAIAKLIANESLRAKMGESGRLRFSEDFTATRMARQTAKLYRTLATVLALNPAEEAIEAKKTWIDRLIAH